MTGYQLVSGGHNWFRSVGALAGDGLILAFLADHPLTEPVLRWVPGQPTPVPPLSAPRIAVASVNSFRIPTSRGEPFGIAPGPGGTVWFTEFAAGRIGRISPAGAITEYSVPTPGAGPYQITAGPGGMMWFTEYNTTKIGRVTPGGKVSEISLPRPSCHRPRYRLLANWPASMASPTSTVPRRAVTCGKCWSNAGRPNGGPVSG